MVNNDFGGYVRKLRTERNYSLKKLADQIDITPYYLSYIESGRKTNPNQKIIAKMIVVLKMSKSEIEHFLDLHAKVNGIVSYDIAEYIMQNDDIREGIRSARDKQGASPNWEDFISNFTNNM